MHAWQDGKHCDAKQTPCLGWLVWLYTSASPSENIHPSASTYSSAMVRGTFLTSTSNIHTEGKKIITLNQFGCLCESPRTGELRMVKRTLSSLILQPSNLINWLLIYWDGAQSAPRLWKQTPSRIPRTEGRMELRSIDCSADPRSYNPLRPPLRSHQCPFWGGARGCGRQQAWWEEREH